jgi:putative Mn2+ efflux pump MntP
MLTCFLLILLVLSIASETFSGLFVNGYLKNIKAQKILVVGVTISTIHTAMTLSGLMLGNQINQLMGNFADALSAIILLMIGLKIAIKSFKAKFQEMLFELNKPKVLVGFSAATGINSFLAGIAISSFQPSWSRVMLVFLVVSFLVAITAIKAGKASKNFLLAARFSLAGGILLIAGAVIMLLNTFDLVNFAK